MVNRVFEKIQNGRQFFFLNKGSEVSILTKIDPLVMNMIISSQLDGSFLVKMAEMPKLRYRVAGHAQQAKQV